MSAPRARREGVAHRADRPEGERQGGGNRRHEGHDAVEGHLGGLAHLQRSSASVQREVDRERPRGGWPHPREARRSRPPAPGWQGRRRRRSGSTSSPGHDVHRHEASRVGGLDGRMLEVELGLLEREVRLLHGELELGDVLHVGLLVLVQGGPRRLRGSPAPYRGRSSPGPRRRSWPRPGRRAPCGNRSSSARRRARTRAERTWRSSRGFACCVVSWPVERLIRAASRDACAVFTESWSWLSSSWMTVSSLSHPVTRPCAPRAQRRRSPGPRPGSA